MGLGFLEVAFESNRINTAKSWSSRVPGGRKTPMALLLILPAPDPYKHGLLLDGAATEGMLGTGKAAVTAGQVFTVTSVMASLCLSPVYDQPCFGLVFFPSGVCLLQLPTPSLFFLFPALKQCSLGFSCVCVWKWVGETEPYTFDPLSNLWDQSIQYE